MESYTPKNHQAKEKSNPSQPAPRALARGAGSAVPLPCLYSNNSIQPPPKTHPPESALSTVQNLCNLLTPYHRRQAHTLFSNVERLITKVAPSIDHVGFLTLTFPDNVKDPDEAYNRFRSLNSNFLSSWDEISDWICVKERQKRGAWHYHLIAVFKEDIRTGVNFEEIAERKYSSASPYLRRIWKELREAMPNYGFGRPELLPIKTNAEGMARYVGKYVSKHIDCRQQNDKGVRLISYSKGWERNSVNFAWHTENSQEWRRKLALFASYVGCDDIYQVSDKLGPCWAYRYAETIMQIDEVLEGNGGEMAPAVVDATIQKLLGVDPLRVAHRQKVALGQRGPAKAEPEVDHYFGFPF